MPWGGECWQPLAGGWYQDVPSSKKTPALCLARALEHSSTLGTAVGQQLRLTRTIPRMGWPWGQQ